MTAQFRDDCEVAVIGAGPYGLAMAAHLNKARFATRIFGEPMASWRHNMPAGMLLRSGWEASHIADPDNLLTLDTFTTVKGFTRSDSISRDQFIAYGDWVQHHVAPDIDSRKVAEVAPDRNGFCLRLSDGDTVHARRVVLALGLGGQAYRPPQCQGLPDSLVSHTADHADLGKFKGQHVAVIGRGQSACEFAALLSEAGAQVNLITRGLPRLVGANDDSPRHPDRPIEPSDRPVGVGPLPLSLCTAYPDLVHRMPYSLRTWLHQFSRQASAAAWIRPRLSGVPIDAGRTILSLREGDSGVIVDLDNGSREFDHVLLATGYRIDIANYRILSQDLLAAVASDAGSPILAAGYQTNMPGLHVIGAAAQRSYGPLLGRIRGAGPAARAVIRQIAKERAGESVSRRASRLGLSTAQNAPASNLS
jgi:FAD-dependent urate hydroxylase